MKKYLLFAGSKINRLGGWNEFIADFDTTKEALAKIESEKYLWGWAQVVNRDTQEVTHFSF